MSEVTPSHETITERTTQTVVEPKVEVPATKEQEIAGSEKAPVEPKKEEKKELVSDKYATFARKEKSIVKARQELSAEKAQFAKDKADLQAEIAEIKRFRQLRENAKVDPDAYLNEAGLSYGYLTERNLKGGIDPNAIYEKTTRALSEWEKKQEDARKVAEEANKTQAQKDYETRVTNYVNGIYEFVEENKETYELTHINGQQNLIWEVIQEAARRGTELTPKQAADKVEAYLEQQIEKTVTSAKKFKDRFTAPKPQEPAKPGSPTLTNGMAAGTSQVKKHFTDKEREANALMAMNKVLGQ